MTFEQIYTVMPMGVLAVALGILAYKKWHYTATRR